MGPYWRLIDHEYVGITANLHIQQGESIEFLSDLLHAEIRIFEIIIPVSAIPYFKQIKSYWKIGLQRYCCTTKPMEAIQLLSTIKFITTILVSPTSLQSPLTKWLVEQNY